MPSKKWTTKLFYIQFAGLENFPKCPGFDFALNENLQRVLNDTAEVLPAGVCLPDEEIPPLNQTRLTSLFKQASATPDEACTSGSHDNAELEVDIVVQRERKRRVS